LLLAPPQCHFEGETMAKSARGRSGVDRNDPVCARSPARWSRHTRNSTPIAAVTLSPKKDSVVGIVSKSTDQSALAA
jgi:hypothetical protein